MQFKNIIGLSNIYKNQTKSFLSTKFYTEQRHNILNGIFGTSHKESLLEETNELLLP